MKILVPVKQVTDPNVRVHVRPDGRGLDVAGLKTIINPFDGIALEEAIRLREAGWATEVAVVSAGARAAEDALRSALALGADTALLLEHDSPLDSLAVARLLAALVAEYQPQLVLLGKQAIDDDCGQVGQMLSALLDWPLATYASRIVADGRMLTVTREIDAGLEVALLDLPAVVTVDLRLNTPRFATLPNIMKARRKPLDIRSATGLVASLAPQLEVVRVDEPPRRAAVSMTSSVPELITALRDAGAL